MSSTGKLLRLSAWLPQGRSFLAALDEVIPRGLAAAAPPAATLAWLAQAGADGVVLHAGIATRFAAELAAARLPWLLKLTSNSAWAADRSIRGLIGQVETALVLGASGAALNVFAGSTWEKEHFLQLTQAVQEGLRWGMPIVAFINPPAAHPFDPQALAYAARIGAELGADVIKTDYSGDPETFAPVIAACPVPLLVEDTPHPRTRAGSFATAQGAVQAGAAGVLFGQRLWADPERQALAADLLHLLHGGMTERKR